MTQEIRDKAANWLQMVLDGVRNIVTPDPDKFYFGSFVRECNYENHCGTVCCMEGWLPAVIPEQAKWDETITSVRTKEDDAFYPYLIGIPIGDDLWNSLTVPGEQYGGEDRDYYYDLYEDSPFREVAEWWDIVIKQIRNGERDKELIEEETLTSDL